MGRGREYGKSEGNWWGMNVIKVHYMHACKGKNEDNDFIGIIYAN
jgi:hypothetical protein